MIEKCIVLVAVLTILSSCEKKDNLSSSESEAKSLPTRARVARPTTAAPIVPDDLHAAFERAKQMESGEGRSNALIQVAEDAIKIDLGIAGLAIRELPGNDDRKMELIEIYLKELIQAEKLVEARSWADSLDSESEIVAAREKINRLTAELHPERLPASSFTAAGADPIAAEALQNWSALRPAEAIAWAGKLPAGEARAVGLKIVFSQWFGNDATSALSWVDSLHSTSSRREAVQAAAEALSNELLRNNILEEASPKLREELEKGIFEIVRQKEAEEVMPEEEVTPETEIDPNSAK